MIRYPAFYSKNKPLFTLLSLSIGFLFMPLSGCSSLAHRHTRQDHPVMEQATLSPHFHAVGTWRVEGPKKAAGHFDWEHSKKEDELLLLGALSLPVAKIVRQDQNTLIYNARGKALTESEWERTSTSLLGTPFIIPLQPLSSWIQGFLHADKHYAPGKWLERSDTSASVEQNGWNIQWSKKMADLPRPDHIELHTAQLPYRLILDIQQESSAW